jgi:BNR repeat-containing family member
MQTILKIFLLTILLASNCYAQHITNLKIIPVGDGWANNSVNTVVFRKNSLCTYNNTQYIAYYNNDGFVVLGKRKLSGDKWKLQVTKLKGNVADAHNSISIMVDGEGYLHIAWNHHGNQLHYCKTVAPGSLQLTDELPMTGNLEKKITYPEFHSLPNGNLLFFYRDGQSGQGNLVINRYNTKQKQWQQLHSNLIDGEKIRNAYWQACVDKKGTVHISWVWRESADVASNHDMCYAKSIDGGVTWVNSKNEKYTLPVTASTAEYVCRIPQQSELINQTSMYATDEGSPFIASYWKEKGDSIPQYHIIYKINNQWQVQNLGFRKTPFSLSGMGTKRIPISRPQIVCWRKDGKDAVAVIFRDEELGGKAIIAIANNVADNTWQLKELTRFSLGSWEPTHDTELWKKKQQLNLFVQFTEQKDGEGKAAIQPQQVQVLSFKIK